MNHYLDYERCKMRFYESQRSYESILQEKELLFERTQPKGVNAEKDKVQTSMSNDLFDNYLIEKERKLIDERLEEARGIMDERSSLLEVKESELKKSPDPLDKIYVCRYLERRKVREISKRVIYSEPQVYRILKRIRLSIEDMKHDRK